MTSIILENRNHRRFGIYTQPTLFSGEKLSLGLIFAQNSHYFHKFFSLQIRKTNIELASLDSVSSPRPSDSGDYVCVGDNGVGVTRVSATLTVEFPPTMDNGTTVFWSWDQKPVTLYCKGELADNS